MKKFKTITTKKWWTLVCDGYGLKASADGIMSFMNLFL